MHWAITIKTYKPDLMIELDIPFISLTEEWGEADTLELYK